jgi:hypothetical protein
VKETHVVCLTSLTVITPSWLQLSSACSCPSQSSVQPLLHTLVGDSGSIRGERVEEAAEGMWSQGLGEEGQEGRKVS